MQLYENKGGDEFKDERMIMWIKPLFIHESKICCKVKVNEQRNGVRKVKIVGLEKLKFLK